MSRLTLRAVLLCFALLASAAQADVSLGASPAYLDITLDRGKTNAQTILLFNSGKDPVTLHAYAWDWWHDASNPRKFGPPGTFPHSAAKWISFTPEKVTVEPQKAVNVTVVFNTPPDASGGHYAVAWFEATPALNPNSRELRVGARLGVLVMTSIRGASAPKLEIDDLKITPPTATQLLKANFTLNNVGDMHLSPRGTLVVMDKNHHLLGHETFDPRRLLPGEKSAVEIQWGGELAPGDYEAILTADYGDAGATVKALSFQIPPAAKTP